ncbi:hypothetical protein C823_006781 [Eubacterium plexicaudatum ASF492]|nr:hypothetical protein C823_006781 [Eubacterium plexicaudatum ASF492]
MESVWCDETRYHGTVFTDKDKNSKGQCGVSSFYLAKLLEEKNYKVLFCEGDAYFPSSQPIIEHCWIKLLMCKNKDLIIDITADQSGYDKKVVCMTKHELKKWGISYCAKKEYKMQEIKAVGLLRRQEYLESKLKKY